MGPAFQIKKYEKLETEEERVARSREIFDSYIMKELLACSHVSVRPSCPQATTCVLAPRDPKLEGKKGPCGEFMAASVLPSPSRRVPRSMSRVT